VRTVPVVKGSEDPAAHSQLFKTKPISRKCKKNVEK
jgi:hypothetical protein